MSADDVQVTEDELAELTASASTLMRFRRADGMGLDAETQSLFKLLMLIGARHFEVSVPEYQRAVLDISEQALQQALRQALREREGT